MNTYELLKKIENDNDFLWMLKKGVIPVSVLDRKVYYEAYLSELKKVDKKQAIANVSEDYKKSERTIIRAIKAMDS